MRARVEIEDVSIDGLTEAEIDSLISGRAADRTELVTLSAFLAELRSLRRVGVEQDFVDFHASEAAGVADAVELAPASPSQAIGQPRLWAGIRRRITATGISLMMLLGATGVAWASDTAVPGDWNYGIDRALEAIGIGAGGFTERVAEVQGQFPATGGPGHLEGTSAELPPNDLSRAPFSPPGVALRGRADGAHARVDRIHEYQDRADRVEGDVISDLAREEASGRSEEADPPGKDTKPDTAAEPAKPDKPERPDKAEKGSKQP